MSGRRAFAVKLSKETNDTIRQKIAKSIPKYVANSRPNSSLGCFCEVPFNEVIEPLDFEEFVQSNTSLIASDPLKSMLVFPADDIEVNVCHRVINTIKPITPDFDDVSAQENPHIHQCLRCYTSNWIVVNKKYEQCVQLNDRTGERVAHIKNIGRHEYEVDIEATEGSELFCDTSQDRTPVVYASQATSCKSSRPQSKISDMPPYLRPPLASDEDTSEGSATPPSNRQSVMSEITPTSSTLTSNATTPRGSVYDCGHSRSSRSSWHYIDSPRNSRLERTNSLQSNCGPRGSRTSSIFHLRNSQSDPLIPGLLDEISCDELDRINELRRQEGRHPSPFYLYPFQEEDELIEMRPPVPAPSEPNRHRILVKGLSLKLELEIEPIFASMALYDAKEKKKLSENFYFDMNSESLKRLLSSHIQYQDVSSLSRSCIFNITYPSNDLFLVIKLEKVLQGDVNECAEPYMKDEKNRDKLKTSAALYCERLGKYRMPFAWTAVYLLDVFNGINGNNGHNGSNGDSNGENKGSCNSLDGIKKKYNESGSLSRKGSLERQKLDKLHSLSNEELSDAINNFNAVTLTITSFFKQDNDRLTDEDLYKYLTDLKRPSSTLKRLKCIPGILKIDISPFPEKYPKYCLTPELVRIHPYPDDKGRPIKDVLEFPSKEVFSPHYVYRNLLYIYPKNLNFANRQGSARNIAVKIQIMNNEDEYSALPVIFGKSSCPEFSSEVFTSVNYHNKCPNFNDEIKVKLPSKLTEQTHVLFTFFHIHAKPKQSEQTTNEVLGYTWIPLYRDGRLQTGPYCLPVMMDKPPTSYSFLTPSIQIPNTRWVDNHKGLFTVVVEAVTSIYSLDANLDHFLHLSTAIDEQNIPQRLLPNIENEFKTSILSISSAQIEPLVKFVPIVLNRLIRLLVRPPVINGNQILNISQSVFEAIAAVVNKINATLYHSEYNDIRTGILSTFIQYQVIFPHPQALPHVPQNQSVIDVIEGEPNGFVSSHETNSHMCPPYHFRSNSNPDVPVGVVAESQSLQTRGLDRASSVRSPQQNSQYLSENSIYTNKKPILSNIQKHFHEELVLQWLVSSGSCRETALSNAGFFFDIITKSICEHLAICGTLLSPRRDRFSKQFTDDIISLVNLITSDIINRLNREFKDLKVIHSLNNSIAFFTRDLLSLMDRNYVFNLIRIYFKLMSNIIQFSSETSTNHSFLLRLDFLRIISGHEHFVCLNLPFATPTFPTAPTPSTLPQSWSQNSLFSPLDRTLTTLLDKMTAFSELTDDYRRQHFLMGIVFCSLSLALEMNSASIHSKAINLVRALMTSHDWDCRYNEPEVKSRIASLYLPLIAIVLDALPQLYDWKSDDVFRNDSRTNSLSNTLKRNSDEKRRPIVLNSSSELEDLTTSPLNSPLNQNVAMAIAGTGIFARTAEESYEPRRWPLREDSTKHLLICFLWVLKNANQTVLYRYLSEMSFQKIYQMLEVLKICVSCFEYKGLKAIKKASLMTFKKPFDMKSKLEDAILGLGSARRDLMLRRRERNPPQSSQSFSQSDSLRWRKDHTLTRYNSNAQQMERTKLDYETEAVLEGLLSTELNLVVLDSIEKVSAILVQHLEYDSEQSMTASKDLLGNILQIILHSLSLNQSTLVLQNLFATQRSLTLKFPQIIFDDRFDVEFCADICLQLLRHCSSSVGLVRAQASASLYMLMRQNYCVAQNFAKIKMQVTMSLSHLVGTSKSFNEPYLRRSLKTILVYAVIDADMQESNFPEQVQELVFNLHMILSDTIKMKEYKEDPEMLLDLMYRIAKGYQNSPDLRLTWLQNMSQKHSDRGNHAEAAHCLIHCCALVCEYLHLFENKSYLPVSCVAFQKISANILEESLVSNEVPIDNKDGICTGKSFSESGLIALLEQSAHCFNTSGMYEAVNEVYKLLIPIAEAHHDYKKLASIHGKLQDAFIKIEQQTGRRVFGTFFRVGFYGPKFGDLDREEFVYKEPFLTKLPEISHRLENFYADQFGADFVEVIKDSNAVDVNKLNHEKAYVQITYVEPYFDSWELDSRQTYFEKNYNIKRFIYATPFTMDGRAHGDLHEQYKRKTILTTVNSFPYVKTRIQVQDRQQVVLTPIEVAIEDIQKKTIELAHATYQEPVDSKILQMVLQGCVGTTVNQGPFEVASVFLSESSTRTPQQRPPSPLQNKLKSCFKDFCRKCGDALRKNRSLIGSDQKEYQKELERNYYKFTEKLAPLISANGQQALRALRESYWNSASTSSLRTKSNTLL